MSIIVGGHVWKINVSKADFNKISWLIVGLDIHVQSLEIQEILLQHVALPNLYIGDGIWNCCHKLVFD